MGLSIGVSMGLSSAFGLLYGPAHSTLPFLLLGKVFDIIPVLSNRVVVYIIFYYIFRVRWL